jgi:TonB family protein
MPRPTTQVDVEVIDATASKELDTYLNSSVLPLIRANWSQVISKSKEKVGGDVTIKFKIAKDGSAQAIKLTDGTGHAALGDLAINAISSSGKFAPLPLNLSSVDLRARFNYQPPPNAGLTGSAHGPGFIPSCNHEENVSCITPPKLIFSPPPENALLPGSDSTKPSIKTSMRLIVTTEGKPSHIEILKSLGVDLDQKVIGAVKNWKFLPATRDGQPVPTQIVVEVEFQLGDDK